MKLKKDKKQLDRIKDLIDEIKGDGDKQCTIRATQRPSEEILDMLKKKLHTTDIHVELLDPKKHIGGAEIIFGGNVYSNLISSEIKQIQNHLKKEREL